MGRYSSMICNKCENEERNFHLQLDCFRQNELLICCLNCNYEFSIPLTPEQFKILEEQQNEMFQGEPRYERDEERRSKYTTLAKKVRTNE